jgi:hypothetical protein
VTFAPTHRRSRYSAIEEWCHESRGCGTYAGRRRQEGIFCRLDNKAPACPNGLDDASSDRAAILDLWRRHPGPLIGVRTGEEFSGLDIDRKHPEAVEWWFAHRDRLPQTRTHRTRSGGLHLLFAHRKGLRNSVSLIAKGVDTRGERGYLIWWPAAGLPVLRDAEFAPWPDWLRPPEREVRAPMQLSSRALASLKGSNRNRGYDGVVRRVVNSSDGERNAILFWVGCRFGELVRDGVLFDREALAILVRAARTCGLGAEGG